MRVITTDSFMLKHEYDLIVPENYTGLLYVWDEDMIDYLENGEWFFVIDVGGDGRYSATTLDDIKTSYPEVHTHIIAFLLSGERKTNE